jgi:hypothetical protein
MRVHFRYHPVGAIPRYIADRRCKELGVFVPDLIRKCVAFVGIERDDGSFIPKATGFFAMAGEGDTQRSHFVTAEHVITNIKKQIAKDEREKDVKGNLAVRLNLIGGTSQVVVIHDEPWWSHPDLTNLTDVAVIPASFHRHYFDHFALPLYGRIVEFVSKADLRNRGAVLGQEVAIIGLFRNHRGHDRNEPIVRIGHIAAMPDEPVHTKYCGDTEGYLVEANSIGGLSGSPVFVNQYGDNVRPTVHVGGPVLQIHGQKKDGFVDFDRFPLFGLMHGHWDLPNLTDDAVTEDVDGRKESINTGIGVVIPVHKIIETLYHPELVEMRKKLEEKERNENGATPDVADDSAGHLATDANPNHQADFRRLVNVAGRKRELKD